MPRKARQKKPKEVTALKHDEASRKNIPTAECQAVMEEDERDPIQVAYQCRNPDLDPQLVWRGKGLLQGLADLVVPAPPLFIQEKVHPKALIDDLLRRSAAARARTAPDVDLFADFNGLPDENARTEFYQHDANWANRMILGDSLQVMASLAEREGLRGKVQCIYIDPPYGIKFNSNFQWSTTSRDVKDGNAEHITREPEQVKAFRDTWRYGIHSYLTYLRERLTVARDLLTDSGSVFVQIGDENVHRVRAVMDEVFGEDNFVAQITFTKATAQTSRLLSSTSDYILWYARSKPEAKYRAPLIQKTLGQTGASGYQRIESPDSDISRRIRPEELKNPDLIPADWKAFALSPIRGTRSPNPSDLKEYIFQGKSFNAQGHYCWKTDKAGLDTLGKAGRLVISGNELLYKRYFDDFTSYPMTTDWMDTYAAINRSYVVQTSITPIQRCILMTTDPGDLVLDPTCGSGTTAYVAEQWGRRWVTIDTSRVALALARARIMGARYPYYLFADSPEGQRKEAELAGKAPSEAPTYGKVRQGFVYERVPHITLKSIANNAEIDIIHENYQATLEPLRKALNKALKQKWEEWEVPRDADEKWPTEAQRIHTDWWKQRIARQREIDASIDAKATYEYLYDRPYEDKKRVRVAGQFTVESLSPHRVLDVDENEHKPVDRVALQKLGYDGRQDFANIILVTLRVAGVQQAHKEGKIAFTALTPWPGDSVCGDGRYNEGDEETGRERRAAIFIGPEFGTVSRMDLVAAAREAAEVGFDVLIACAFNYDAQASEFNKLGRVPILKARMNADLHMAGELKDTAHANLFVIFGEPDIELMEVEENQLQVKINGVDVYHPNAGEIRSNGAEGIACWFLDTDYDEVSFLVRHAYFLGANDPYKLLKTTLQAEIDPEAWATLNSDISRPFDKPESGRIAVKVINRLGDEVMKVFRV